MVTCCYILARNPEFGKGGGPNYCRLRWAAQGMGVQLDASSEAERLPCRFAATRADGTPPQQPRIVSDADRSRRSL